MNSFKKMIMIRKLQTIQPSILLQYAKKYDIPISSQQAEIICEHLKENMYDPTKVSDRTAMLKKLAQITDMQTAKRCNQLFQQLIKQYGVENMF
ncbi:DUF2624 family protein [Gracilibacillus marinus]|jgi:hypothetical protein|uniref:DUF2624 family protein n=1 Tax=Gracilibacillus marinus TaxID=630535 RepID=A0ABV8VXA9_9BACI